MVVKRDEFVDNADWRIMTGEDEFGIQHISRKPRGAPLCGVRIIHALTWDMFTNEYLCEKCVALYLDKQGETTT